MKIKGKKIERPNPVKVPIPREGNDIVFICGAVLDFTEFEALCPEPKPPLEMRPGKGNLKKRDDPGFIQKLEKYANMRTAWMIIQSISETPDFEWEVVDLKNPETWEKYEEEMAEVLTPAEIDRVVSGVLKANVPTEDRQKEALERFVASQVGEEKDLSQQVEHAFT